MSAAGLGSGTVAAPRGAATPVPRVLRSSRGGHRGSALRRQYARWGTVFVTPAAVLLLVLTVWPLLQAVYYSFTDWDGREATWIGWDNYVNAVATSPDLVRVIVNNLVVVASTPFAVAFALVVAYLLSLGPWGARLFRAAFFIPVTLSWVVIGLAWGYLLSSRGAVNGLLKAVGLDALAQDWLGTPSTSLPMIIMVFTWGYLGMNVLLLYTGMMSIDKSVLEAARLDGVSGVAMIRHIVLPHVRRYVELSLILTISAAITQLFGLIFTMTSGGPGVSSTTLEYALYISSFKMGQFGQGAALGMILFLASLVLTFLRIRSGVRGDDD